MQLLKCPEPEVRTHRAASPTANFGFKRGTRIICLLVSFRFRSSRGGAANACELRNRDTSASFHDQNRAGCELDDTVRPAPDHPFVKRRMARCADDKQVGGKLA